MADDDEDDEEAPPPVIAPRPDHTKSVSGCQIPKLLGAAGFFLLLLPSKAL